MATNDFSILKVEGEMLRLINDSRGLVAITEREHLVGLREGRFITKLRMNRFDWGKKEKKNDMKSFFN